jgi:hypothetical protein
MFKFKCGECGFNAEGPSHLREFVAEAHAADDACSVATVAIIDLERDLDEHPMVGDKGGSADVKGPDLNDQPNTVRDVGGREIVQIAVESMSDSDGLGDALQCPVCQNLFVTEEELAAHLNRPDVCAEPRGMEALRHAVEVAQATSSRGMDSRLDLIVCGYFSHKRCKGADDKKMELGVTKAQRPVVEVARATSSRDTDSTLDLFVCKYCRKHCEATIKSPDYERMECPLRAANDNRSRVMTRRELQAMLLVPTTSRRRMNPRLG